MTPAKYDQLDYTPTHGSVEVRGRESTWAVDVSINQGRAMEVDGVDVYWAYSGAPALVAEAGLTVPAMWLHRLLTWPSRIFQKRK